MKTNINIKCIKIFDSIFTIESESLIKDNKPLGWIVKVSVKNANGSGLDYADEYIDYVNSRTAAEEACFGYFLIQYCRGGIFWKECNFPE